MSSPTKPLLLALGALAAVACTTVSDDTASVHSAFAHPGTGQRFLLAFWSGDLDKDEPYNGEVFGDTRPYPADLASPRDLASWKLKFMPSSEPVVSSLYKNVRELGEGFTSVEYTAAYFWRRMTCTERFVRGGPGGCVVTNYDAGEDHDPNDQEENDGTVAMSITQDGFVHFALYEPSKVGSSGSADPERVRTTTDAQLDGEGDKLTPHVCVNCHSGTIADGQDLLQKPDLGSVFREFEPSLIEAPRGVSQAAAEQQWYDLNQAVLAANAALRSESEGAPGGLEHSRASIASHIHDLYDGLGEPKSHTNAPFSRSVGASELMPPSWRAQDADSQALWTSLVNPYCMECHRHNQRDFSDFDNFSFLRTATGGKSLLAQYVVDDGRKDQGLPYMPQSQAAFNGLQWDAAAWGAIRRWSGMPASEAVVEIAADQPHWPSAIAVSTDTVTAQGRGAMGIRFVNKSSHPASACYGDDDDDDDDGCIQLAAAKAGAPPAQGTLAVPVGANYDYRQVDVIADHEAGRHAITVRHAF